jgi:hypothetical protein
MSLAIWNRPEAKSIDPSATIALTAEQVAARNEFAQHFSELLSTDGTLESLGAFITPSNNGSSNMVALTLNIPALSFTNPDGGKESTRNFSLNINANIPVVKNTANKAARPIVATTALTYAELKAQTAARRAERAASK